jgi:hypothetical protein
MRGSVAARLLGLRVRIPSGAWAWMFVVCVYCTVRTKDKNQDNPDEERSMDKVQRESKRIKTIPLGPRFSALFQTRCVGPIQPPIYTMGIGSLHRG